MASEETKLKELILYISQRCADQPKYGAVKLNKILYFSDFLFYANHGRAITGVEYQKLEHGPAPKRLVPLRAELIEERALAIQAIQLLGGKSMKRPVNLRAANLSVFTAEEIAMVDSVIDALKDTTADQVSELTHRMVGWKAARAQEVIPYETIFLSDEPLSESEKLRAREILSGVAV